MASIDASRAGAQILPFYLAGETGEAALVRGRFATVGVPVTQILARHGYPDAVAGLQAEAMAIAACLSTFMKFDGVFTLQAKGDAYVKTLLADVTSDGALRGYTAFDDEVSPPVGDDMVAAMPASVPALLGTGYVAFTVDQGSENGRYQGIVELDGETLSDAATAWFANSEQVDSHIVAAAGRQGDSWTASALMVQRVAADGGTLESVSRAVQDDAWTTAEMLLRSVRREELIDPALAPEALVFRLFNALRPHVAPAQPVVDRCRCSPDRVTAVLERMSAEELADLVTEAGTIDVTCEFCKTTRSITPPGARH
ncbi:MAG: Hsp33 family molecular chaperone HslO [Pseudomonadota bacterium]|nr:Hsp33 family molecular chaperone HslO [Pseudomonadota bacterium]MEC8539722.1 Hsp33 family molecular chaperone HslO [Pseudomonadota bacterium]MEC8549128.1 Hsp33 family molecular chaperone HslO [Pseudomonadota bacterium]MEC8712632.1 Hsp33 family molecular chaperone HslO [Pseudomonadota bacterium]MEE3025236.1 Hsp33 family molecular chaperone HslO [Pseudomonadota bacterium]